MAQEEPLEWQCDSNSDGRHDNNVMTRMQRWWQQRQRWMCSAQWPQRWKVWWQCNGNDDDDNGRRNGDSNSNSGTGQCNCNSDERCDDNTTMMTAMAMKGAMATATAMTALVGLKAAAMEGAMATWRQRDGYDGDRNEWCGSNTNNGDGWRYGESDNSALSQSLAIIRVLTKIIQISMRYWIRWPS